MRDPGTVEWPHLFVREPIVRTWVKINSFQTGWGGGGKAQKGGGGGRGGGEEGVGRKRMVVQCISAKLKGLFNIILSIS